MRYLVLATDYDGTLAEDGRVAEATLEALGRWRQSGRRLILVTGRELDDLLAIFPRVDLFERVVVENGALLYRPATREEKVLAADLARRLRPGGRAVLSGLLRRQEPIVLAPHRGCGIVLERRLVVDGWSTLILRPRRRYR